MYEIRLWSNGNYESWGQFSTHALAAHALDSWKNEIPPECSVTVKYIGPDNS